MPDWPTRSGSRPGSEHVPPTDDGRDRPGPEVEDWNWDEIEWGPEQAGERSGAPSASPRLTSGGVAPARDATAGHDARHAQTRRRRLAALAALGAVLILAVVIPLVVFGGGGGSAEPTTALTTTTTTTTQTTTAQQPTTTTTTTPQSSAPAAKPLRLALAAGARLNSGDRGADVVTLQKGLAALGFSPGRPDGIFGPITEAAVIDFQRSNNLAPDGVVGTDTAKLLNTALAKRGVNQ
jgi:hypothetical protein